MLLNNLLALYWKVWRKISRNCRVIPKAKLKIHPLFEHRILWPIRYYGPKNGSNRPFLGPPSKSFLNSLDFGNDVKSQNHWQKIVTTISTFVNSHNTKTVLVLYKLPIFTVYEVDKQADIQISILVISISLSFFCLCLANRFDITLIACFRTIIIALNYFSFKAWIDRSISNMHW